MSYHSGGDHSPYGPDAHAPAASGAAGGQRGGGGGVPDSVLVGALALMTGLTLLTWTSTGIAAWVVHGHWPEGVTFLGTALAVRSFLTAPGDVAGAWPDADPSELPGATVLWLVFLAQLVLLFSTVLWGAMRLARRRALKAAARRGPADGPAPGSPVQGAGGPAPDGSGTAAGHPAHAAGDTAGAPAHPAHLIPQQGVPGDTSSSSPPLPGAASLPAQRTGPGHPGPQAGSASPRDAVSEVLGAPGGLVVVDPDGSLWERTAARRGRTGPVHVYDPGHLTDAPVRLRWAPHRGCEEMPAARRRARSLLAPVRPAEPVFQLDAETAETLLRCFLHAAALTGEPFPQVHRWAQGKSPGEAGKILRSHRKAAGGAAMEFDSAMTAHAERRDSGLRLIGRALEGLDRLHIRQTCAPGKVDTLALDNLSGEEGTLYVVGRTSDTAALCTALVDALALEQPGLAVVGGPPPASP